MIAPDSDTRDVLPESDPASWPAWTDNWYWEPDTDLPAADRLAQAADTLERAAEFLAAMDDYDAANPIPDPLPETFKPLEAWLDRYTPESFTRIASIASRSHVD
jgi:hypothetical protein